MVRFTQLAGRVSGVALLALGAPAYGQTSTAVESEAEVPAEESAAFQGAAPSESTAIVVTGSRLRAESVQDVPVAVSVFDTEMLEDLHAADIQALTSNPPVLFVSSNPTGHQWPPIRLCSCTAVAPGNNGRGVC